MDKKYGVYICTGCGIGDAFDVDALVDVAKKENKIPVCKTHPFLCGAEGVELIKKDIEAEGVNTIVIAACSGRVNYDVFDFGPDKIVERANLREQGAWVHEPDDEDTTMLGEDIIQMACAKVKAMELPEPFQVEDISKSILVVGGGMAGITAALETAKAGYKTTLVEKESSIGGWLNKLYKVTPLAAPYTELEDPNVAARVKELEENQVTVYTSAKIKKIAGAPGMFDATIDVNGSEVTERFGAIVLASGAVPVDNDKLDYLGYGKHKNVITHADLEAMAKNGKIVRPSDGQEAKKIVFIQCAGSRDKERLPYCSAACCVESLKQSIYVSQLNPEASAYIIYKDIRSSGTYEHFYKKAQESGTVFIKGDVTGITEAADGTLTVESEDVLLGGKAQVEGADLVVLATGMVPTTALGKSIVEEVQDEAAASENEEEQAVSVDNIIASDILNLEYRQGPELPTLKYGFPDSHYICFPYETRRTGIYAAGAVRAPMDMAKAVTDATGAALKAIQCVEATAQGAAVHPRSGDLSYPIFNLNRCTQCKRCTEECPFGAINEDEKTNPLPNPTRCRRCGTCMGACPERIISFKNYSVPMIGNMFKASSMPEELDEKPRILVFACENDAIPALDMAGINRLKYNPWVRIIPVRCLGSLNLVWINDAMSAGYDGVLLMGCKHGEDYQCHFIKGSELAEIRLSKVSETLDRLGLESERVRAIEVNIMDYLEIPKILDQFAEDLEELGPNPMKDF